ncbi:MAG: VWA domain-containing protein [Acidobacteriota bacterium]|nr:MAG: VWA domain-containing protein [Acidobacteriota bacterium]
MNTYRRRCRRLLGLALLALGILYGEALASEGVLIPEENPPELCSPFLLEQTDAEIKISGPIAHAVVTQTWTNPNAHPVDGLYIFPLPEKAAVTDMSLKIGDRWIRGEMKRREEARAIYEQAKREGRVAGLLDQERPNIFAQRVANIMPGVRIEVIIEYDDELGCEADSCEYVFPTVVGPRFIPADQEDPGQIDPPVVEQGQRTKQRLSLRVDLEAGVPIRDLNSPSHRVVVDRFDETRGRVTVAEADRATLDRDFKLRWRVGGEAPELGLLAWRDPEQAGEYGVFSLILQPPRATPDELAARRELVFVLDCSGSMRGAPLRAAKNVVRQALAAVRPGDTFQIIRFSEQASGLGLEPLAANPENRQRALAYLDSLTGGGGTHMLAGIRAALDRPTDPERVRIVAFLTDGYIGNEQQIFAEVRRLIGEARLFSFGIGSSVNHYLLEGLAEEGRGVAAFLGPRETPDEMVERFVRRIETPALTDIRITWEDVEVEDLEPANVPDLFDGQPLLVHGRYRRPGSGLVIVEGKQRGRPASFRHVITLFDRAEDNEALARLWARARIHRLERELHEGDRDDVTERIVDLGLRYRLMTRWTSLVAVDSEISNQTGTSQSVTVPVEMPEDVSYEGVFGHGRAAMASGKISSLLTPTSPPPVGYREQARIADESRVRAEYERQDRKVPPPPRPTQTTTVESFTRVTLVRADGTQIVVEEDGELWRISDRRRQLVRALSAAQLVELRTALKAVSTASWSGAARGPRLVVELAGVERSAALPSGSGAIDTIAALIERWAGP